LTDEESRAIDAVKETIQSESGCVKTIVDKTNEDMFVNIMRYPAGLSSKIVSLSDSASPLGPNQKVRLFEDHVGLHKNACTPIS
jgi:hypothetical protein